MIPLVHVSDIVLASDEGYYDGLLVTICSAACHLTTGRAVTFHILDGGLRQDQRSHLIQCLKILSPESSLAFIPLDTSAFEGLPAIRGESQMTYARLASPKLISSDHFLYIDCDLLILKNLAEFPNHLSRDQICYGIMDPTYTCMKLDHASSPLTPEEKKMPYLNAGVLLINREAWLAENVSARCIDFLKKHPKARAWDQTAINHITLPQKIVSREFSWNKNITRYSNQSILRESLSQIFHYIGAHKPWTTEQTPPENAAGHLIYHLFCQHLFKDSPVAPQKIDLSSFNQRALKKRLIYTLTCQKTQRKRWHEADLTSEDLVLLGQKIENHFDQYIPKKTLPWSPSS